MPANITIFNKGKSQLEISWNYPGGRVDKYITEVYKDSMIVENVTDKATSVQIPRLQPGTTYMMKIYSLIMIGDVPRLSKPAEITETTCK